MSYGLGIAKDRAALHSADGNLVFVRVRVAARLLEEMLEALATASFPINPEIRHSYPFTTVEFPAYDTQIAEIRSLIRGSGITDVTVDLADMLAAIA